MQKIIYTLLVIITTNFIYAQSGRISGIIVDSKTGETLPGATILISGTTKGASADFDGKFALNNVPAGKVSLVISYISYTTKKITDVTVIANDVTDLNVQLDPSTSQDLQEVEVVVTLNKENNTALVLQQKNNASVSDGVSAETIKRTPDRNTSDVLKRVSGASIQDNKFAIVRGLNDRYNASYLNGAPLPSTESDRKAFSFDIFPSNMLDNLVITKTARPDLPGEFAGGIIEINTKSIPEKNFLSISAGGGYNAVTTFKEELYAKKSKTDWIGIDDGTRSMPKEIPDFKNFSINIHEQAKYAKEIPISDWNIYNRKFSPNSSYQLAAGYNFKRNEKDFFGLLGSLTYNNTNSYFTTDRISYQSGVPNSKEDPLLLDKVFYDKTYQNQKLMGALVNMSCKLNENNSISSKNLYSVNTDDRTIARSGSGTPTEPNPNQIKSTAFWYTQNNILSSQLIGEHFMPKPKLKITWNGAYTIVKRKVPNLRRHVYSRLSKLVPMIPEDPNEPPIINPKDTVYKAEISSNNSGGPDYGGSFLYSDLNENIKSVKTDISKNFKINPDLNLETKLGGFFQVRNRIYDIRQFTYSKYGGSGQTVSFKDSLLYLNEESLFTQGNMGLISPGVGGLKLVETSQAQDSYRAGSRLTAAYFMADLKYKSFLRFVGGLRAESYLQTLSYHDHQYYFNGLDTEQDTTVNDILPSANFIFSLNDKQNIRVSYSKTLNRPEFREIAPLVFYDFNTQFSLHGTPTLKRAAINNYDFRYEIYPGAGQLASASFFYKDFNNPIEIVHLQNAREIKYYNSNRAQCYGAELEYRINLGILTKKDSTRFGKFLNKTTFFSNLALIKSKVDIIDVNSGLKQGERPLQGQSPYIINGGLSFIDTKYNYSFSLSYNRFGPRIYIVGNNTYFNNLWELGRNVLDFQATKGFFKNKLEIRFNVKDVLANIQPQVFYQEFDKKTGYNKTNDALFWKSWFGATYSLLISYKF